MFGCFRSSKFEKARELLNAGDAALTAAGGHTHLIDDSLFIQASKLLTEYMGERSDEKTRLKVAGLLTPYCSPRLDAARSAISGKDFETARRILNVYLQALPKNPIALNLLESLPSSDLATKHLAL